MSSYDLIIFDCDGTLVDSERVYSVITSELLTEAGFPEYTPAVCNSLFAGLSWSEMRIWLEEKHRQPMPENIVHRYTEIARERMEAEIKAVHGAHDVLSGLEGGNIKTCVASNGERGNVLRSLKVTKVLDFFPEPHVFTRIQVERPKPAPDIFLYAAESMGCAPEKTLVIEDSHVGVTAALAANMDVVGFTGTAHHQGSHELRLKEAGAHGIIDSLIHIPAILRHGKGWKKG
ncbi:MAG TPA: HAD family hydrolase [Rhodospirillaceae bacterium]|nr:HAD family hydrolase [Rhodospirillaceae bacterium]